MPILRPDEYQHTNPNYAFMDASQQRGGARTILNISEISTIPADKRAAGMLISVTFYDESSPGAVIGGEFKLLQYVNVDLTDVKFTDLTNWRDVSEIGAVSAVDVSYSNAVSGLTAVDVQAAIDELVVADTAITDLLATLGTAAFLDSGTESGNLGVLNSEGKFPESMIPSIAINTVQAVETIAERDALTGLVAGDVVIVTDSEETSPEPIPRTYMYNSLGTWTLIANPIGDLLLTAIISATDVQISSVYSAANATIPAANATDAGVMTNVMYSKLDGIEEGAEVNVNPDWDAVGTKAEILNKPTDVTDLSTHSIAELQDTFISNPAKDEGLIWSGTNWIPGKILVNLLQIKYADGVSIKTDTGGDSISLTLATTEYAGLISPAEKSAIANITEQEQSNWQTTDTNSKAYILNKPSDLTDLSNHSIGDLSDVDLTGVVNGAILVYNGTNWVVGSLATNLAVDTNTGTNTVIIESSTGDNATLPIASPTTPGVMTKEDKSKLDKFTVGTATGTILFLNASGNYVSTSAPTTAGQTLQWDGSTWIVSDASPSNTNLGTVREELYITITSSTGDNTDIPAASASQAGLILATEKVSLATINAGTAGQKARSNGASGITYVEDNSENVAFTPQTTTIFDPSVDTAKKALDAVDTEIAAIKDSTVSTNLGVLHNETTQKVDISSSTGDGISIDAATIVLPGIMTAGDKILLNTLVAGNTGQKVRSNGTSGVIYVDDTASYVFYDKTGTDLSSTDVQGAIGEIYTRLSESQATDASVITYTPAEINDWVVVPEKVSEGLDTTAATLTDHIDDVAYQHSGDGVILDGGKTLQEAIDDGDIGGGGIVINPSIPDHDGAEFIVSLEEGVQERLIFSDGVTSASVGYSLPTDAGEQRRTCYVILDNTGNNSAIESLIFTSPIYWVDGDPFSGVPANSRITVKLVNISATEVDGYTY